MREDGMIRVREGGRFAQRLSGFRRRLFRHFHVLLTEQLLKKLGFAPRVGDRQERNVPFEHAEVIVPIAAEFTLH
jgi:hypothetical protein